MRRGRKHTTKENTMKNQVVLVHADSGCCALIINHIVVAESDLAKDTIKIVTDAAFRTGTALRVPVLECSFVIPEEIDGKWTWNEVLHLLNLPIQGMAPAEGTPEPILGAIEIFKLDELAEFERAMCNLGFTHDEFRKAVPGCDMTYRSKAMEAYWKFWSVRAILAKQTVAPYVEALQDLAQVDGSYDNVSNAEVLASRIRIRATAALRLNPIDAARATAAMQFASAMTAACKLEGQAKREALAAASKAAHEAGINPEQVGRN